MNWLESIEKAIEYIESHLKDDLSLEDVASHVYMSIGYFQKAFSMLCGLYRDMSSDREHLEGFELRKFPAATWAVFVCKGDSRADAKEKTFNRITREWFPQTNYRVDDNYYVMISYQTPADQNGNDDLGIYYVPIVEA